MKEDKDNEKWVCIKSKSVKVVKGYELLVETLDGNSWSASVSEIPNYNRFILKIAGLKDQSVALSVADDLHKLAATITEKDMY